MKNWCTCKATYKGRHVELIKNGEFADHEYIGPDWAWLLGS